MSAVDYKRRQKKFANLEQVMSVTSILTIEQCKTIPFNKDDTFESGRYFHREEFEHLTDSDSYLKCVIDYNVPEYSAYKIGFSHYASNFQFVGDWLCVDITVLNNNAGRLAKEIIDTKPYAFRPSYLGRLWSDCVVTDVSLLNINLLESLGNRETGIDYTENPSPNDVMRYQDL